MRCWASVDWVDRYSAAFGTWGPTTNMAGYVVSIRLSEENSTEHTEVDVWEFLNHSRSKFEARAKVAL